MVILGNKLQAGFGSDIPVYKTCAQVLQTATGGDVFVDLRNPSCDDFFV